VDNICIGSLALPFMMLLAKNHSGALESVKVINKILWVSFFSRHGVLKSQIDAATEFM